LVVVLVLLLQSFRLLGQSRRRQLRLKHGSGVDGRNWDSQTTERGDRVYVRVRVRVRFG